MGEYVVMHVKDSFTVITIDCGLELININRGINHNIQNTGHYAVDLTVDFLQNRLEIKMFTKIYIY